MDVTGDREDFFCIKLYHGAIRIFAVDREEVQKFSNMLFTAVKVTFVPGSLRNEIVCKLLKNCQGPGRIEVKHISILLPICITIAVCE